VDNRRLTGLDNSQNYSIQPFTSKVKVNSQRNTRGQSNKKKNNSATDMLMNQVSQKKHLLEEKKKQ
jgi:hypothetical protein